VRDSERKRFKAVGRFKVLDVKDFRERNIPTKARQPRPIRMSQDLMEFCKTEIKELLNK
jgi:hypothetical protein